MIFIEKSLKMIVAKRNIPNMILNISANLDILSSRLTAIKAYNLRVLLQLYDAADYVSRFNVWLPLEKNLLVRNVCAYRQHGKSQICLILFE